MINDDGVNDVQSVMVYAAVVVIVIVVDYVDVIPDLFGPGAAADGDAAAPGQQNPAGLASGRAGPGPPSRLKS